MEAELFIGRQREIDALSAALDRACAGKGSVALLSGEPGIGKTRTATELVAGVRARGGRAWWGRCHEEAGAPPFPGPGCKSLARCAWTVTAANPSHLGAGAPDIAEIVPELRVRFPDIEPAAMLSDPSETRFGLFGALTRFLISVCRRANLGVGPR